MVLTTVLFFIAGLVIAMLCGYGIVRLLLPRRYAAYQLIIAPPVGYAVYCWLAFSLSGTFRLPLEQVIRPAFVPLVALSVVAAVIVEPRHSRAEIVSVLALMALLSSTMLVITLWPLFHVGIDTYLGAVNPDYFASFRDNYYLLGHSVVELGLPPDSYAPFLSSTGDIRLSARFSSALFAPLLQTLLPITDRAALTLAIGLFICSLPLSLYFMVRVAFGQSRIVGILSSLLIGISGSVAMSYLFFYVGQNSALAMVPLLLTILYLLVVQFSFRILLLSAITLSSFVVMYMGMLPYAIGPVALLGLYLVVRRQLSLRRAITIVASLVATLIVVNLGMLPFMIAVILGWQEIVGQVLQGQYFIDFVTEQFFPMFLGMAVYPVNTSVQVDWFGGSWLTVALGLSVLGLVLLGLVAFDWARRAATTEQRVLGISAALLYAGAWTYYTFIHEYAYAVFKMSTWLQFILVPLVAYGLWRLWSESRKARRWAPRLAMYGALAIYSVLFVGGNALASFDYGRKGLGNHAAGGYIVNSFQVSGNHDYLELASNVGRFVKPGESIGLAMSDSILNNWLSYYLRDFKLSYLSHELFPGDDEVLPDVFTRVYIDVYGHPLVDEQKYFHGATDDYYLTLNSSDLNSDIIDQPLPEPVWHDNTFSLYRSSDAPDFLVTGRGFYRLEHQVPQPGFWWPDKFRWTAGGGEVYMLRAAHPGQPYRLSFVGIVGPGIKSAHRTVELWLNQTLFDTIEIDGSARVLSAPFYPTGGADRLVMKTRETTEPRPRQIALWNPSIPSDYRQVNLAVADISVLGPDAPVTAVSALDQPVSASTLFETSQAFNGISPNAWVRDQLDTTIVRPSGSQGVAIDVLVPGTAALNFPYQMTLDVDGKTKSFTADHPGAMSMAMALPTVDHPTPTRIRLTPGQTFDSSADPTDHSAQQSVQLQAVTFGSTPNPNSGFALSLPPEITETSGIDSDGWMLDQGVLTVRDPVQQSMLELELELPQWALVDAVGLTPQVNGVASPRQAYAPGIHVLRLPLAGAGAQTQVVLNADRSFTLPAPDTRVSSLRIRSVKLVDAGS